LRGVLIFSALHLVADYSARAQAYPAADRGTSAWMTDRCANDSAGNGATDSTDTGTLLTSRKRASGTTGKHKRAGQ
jgi:hypothetical protein